MNKKKQQTVTKEEYKIKDIFAKETVLNVNEILKKTFIKTIKDYSF